MLHRPPTVTWALLNLWFAEQYIHSNVNKQSVFAMRLQNPGCYRSIMEATASIRIGFLHHRTPCFPLRPVVSAPASTILRLLPHQEVAGRAWVGSSTRHCAAYTLHWIFFPLLCTALTTTHFAIAHCADVIYAKWSVQSARQHSGWGSGGGHWPAQTF